MDTGLPSTLSKSSGLAAIPKAMTNSLTAVHLPCGIAIPEPMPVLQRFFAYLATEDANRIFEKAGMARMR